MKLFSPRLLFLTVLALALSGPRRHSAAESKQFEDIRRELREMTSKGQFAEAIPKYQLAADKAQAAGLRNYQLKFLSNLAVCQLFIFQFQSALATMNETRNLAKVIGDQETLAALDSNMSSLFFQLGNWQEAMRVAEEGVLHADALQPEQRAILYGQLGTVQAQMGKMELSERSFAQAIQIASQSKIRRSQAWALDSLAYARWKKANRLREAESAATEALELRTHSDAGSIESSLMILGGIRADMGDLASAEALLDRAESALRKPGSRTPPWLIYMRRGKTRMLAGDLEAALSDLRTGVFFARAWRADVVANDANRSGSEGTLDELYRLQIEAGNRLYLKTHDPELIRETFEAAEENRSASLRALLPKGSDWRNRLSPHYYELLARLQPKEAAELQSGGSRPSAELQQLRSELGQIEAKAGAPSADQNMRALDQARASLDGESVLFSFQLGEERSWIWAVTQKGISLYQAPGEKALEIKINQLRRAAESNGGDLERIGGELYQNLFGEVAPEILSRKRWILIPEGKLFDLPFPVLRAAGGKYLIADHSLQIAPGALMMQSGARQPDRDREFLAVGDPIYNFADPRATKRKNPGWPSFLRRANFNAAPAFARLWGTAREIEASALAWDAPKSVLLTGHDVSPANFWEHAREKPDIIHIATHILEGNDESPSGLIAFGMGRDADMQFITPEDILARSISARLVVLSGCSSGKAEIRPATGLMGLTRAWIAAGAGSVLATRWPTVDDDGAFFKSFYANLRLRKKIDPAEALRMASLEMLKSGSWRAKPSFWAGYFVVGNY